MKTLLQSGIIFYLNSRGKAIGFINENREYITKRDSTKGQIFLNPRYMGAMAIDLEIVKDLVAREVKLIKIKVIGFERVPFWATITPQDFLIKGEIFQYERRNFRGQMYRSFEKQIRLPLNRFIRQYDEQRNLF